MSGATSRSISPSRSARVDSGMPVVRTDARADHAAAAPGGQPRHHLVLQQLPHLSGHAGQHDDETRVRPRARGRAPCPTGSAAPRPRAAPRPGLRLLGAGVRPSRAKRASSWPRPPRRTRAACRRARRRPSCSCRRGWAQAAGGEHRAGPRERVAHARRGWRRARRPRWSGGRRAPRPPRARRAISAPLVSSVKPSSSSVPMVTSSRSMRRSRGGPRSRRTARGCGRGRGRRSRR